MKENRIAKEEIKRKYNNALTHAWVERERKVVCT